MSRARAVPSRHSGKEMNIQMSSTTTMEPNGTAASEWYAIATVFSAAAMPKQAMGKSVAVASIVPIQFLPSLRA